MISDNSNQGIKKYFSESIASVESPEVLTENNIEDSQNSPSESLYKFNEQNDSKSAIEHAQPVNRPMIDLLEQMKK